MNSSLKKDSKEQINILEKVDKSAIKFLDKLSLKDTYKTIVEEIKKIADADYCHILLEDKGELKSAYASPIILATIKRRANGFTEKTWKKNKIFQIEGKDILNIHPELKKMGIKSTIFLPLTNRGKCVGVITIHSTRVEKITARMRQALKLFSSMAALAIRKSQLYDDINNALEMRDLFISMAAHEFRTPLTTINGYVQLLSKRIENIPESSWIREMSWECYRLNLMVNELLEINRIKSGKLTYNWQECHLRTIIRRAITNFNFGHKDRKVQYEEGNTLQLDNVIGDFDKLLQVFTNILDNAAKFSDPDSTIRMSFTYRYPWFTIAISNTGEKIDKKDLSKVFEQFYKGSEHKQGLGLGLFLSKNIVERHKGTIAIKSSGKTTTTIVKLPRAKV